MLHLNYILMDGSIQNIRLRSDENIEEAYLDKRTYEYLYSSGSEHVLMRYPYIGQAVHDQVGQDEQAVASVDGLGYAPDLPDGGAAPPQVTLVLNVVVNKGEVVHQLKGRSSRQGLLRMVGQRRRLLAYLKRKDYERYQKVISQLGLRK